MTTDDYCCYNSYNHRDNHGENTTIDATVRMYPATNQVVNPQLCKPHYALTRRSLPTFS